MMYSNYVSYPKESVLDKIFGVFDNYSGMNACVPCTGDLSTHLDTE